MSDNFTMSGLSKIDRLNMKIEQIEAELAKREWQPIETCPDKPDVVLFFIKSPRRNYVEKARADDWSNVAMFLRFATHWMPLPEPPRKEQDHD